MGDHAHKAGEWMLSYRYSFMKMDGNRLAIEVGLPLYQDLDGPQLKNDYSFTIGWQLSI